MEIIVNSTLQFDYYNPRTKKREFVNGTTGTEEFFHDILNSITKTANSRNSPKTKERIIIPKPHCDNPENNQFSCNIVKFRCFGCTRTGDRCSRQFGVGLPFCFQHSLKNFSLKIAPTLLMYGIGNTLKRLPMNGLFACGKAFEKQQLICPYFGKSLKVEELNKIFPGRNCVAPYSTDYTQNYKIDAACVRGIGAYANSVLPSTQINVPTNLAIYVTSSGTRPIRAKPNARLSFLEENNQKTKRQLWLVASEKIKDGDEIFIDYTHAKVLVDGLNHKNSNIKRAKCKKTSNNLKSQLPNVRRSSRR